MKIFLDNKLFFLSFAIIGLLLFFPALAAQAAYKIEIGLPNMPASISDPGQYVKYLFLFGLSLAGFLAVGAIAIGGIQYMLAGASIGNVQKAKDLIIGALLGIGLLLGSYLLLYTIDPTLVNLSPKIPSLGNIAAPKEIIGVDYGMAETSTTKRFIFNGVKNPEYGTEAGCRALTQLDAYKNRLIGDGYMFNDSLKECTIVIKK